MDPNNPWAMPPIPKRGDPDINTIWRSVGEALSYWEWIEGYLSLIFNEMVSTQWSAPAHRAYGGIVSFNGRADMLRNAAEAFFVQHPDDALEAKFTETMKLLRRASPRRNDIAHGIAQPYFGVGPTHGYLLYPSFFATNRRDVAGLPAYGMNAAQIDRFGKQFYDFQPLVMLIQGELMAKRMAGS